MKIRPLLEHEVKQRDLLLEIYRKGRIIKQLGEVHHFSDRERGVNQRKSDFDLKIDVPKRNYPDTEENRMLRALAENGLVKINPHIIPKKKRAETPRIIRAASDFALDIIGGSRYANEPGQRRTDLAYVELTDEGVQAVRKAFPVRSRTKVRPILLDME